MNLYRKTCTYLSFAKRSFSALYLMTALLTFPLFADASMNDHHDDEHQEEGHTDEGVHGGKRLVNDDIEIEITMFESGIPAEMRIYAYKNDHLLAPTEYQLSVTLNRLGGEQNILTFSPERDYNVSNQSIAEPHSYDVTIKARINDKTIEWQYDSHEGRTEISDRLLTLSGVKTELAQAQTLIKTDTLFGVISPIQDQVFQLHAPYSSLVEKVLVQTGDTVKKGQKLITLRNTETLQTYSLKSPSHGEVTARFVNQGDRADQNSLLEISNLSQVWVDLSAFPENIENLKIGQNVAVYDMHNHERSLEKISYVAPQMTGGHIARARATISNAEGHWRPGMHIKADVEISNRLVPLAVKETALQNFRGMPVVFARYDNTFEVRMIEVGERNDEWVEVLNGLKLNTEYVTENSFLLKADVLKEGASHDH